MKKIALIFLSLAITLTAGWWRTYGGEGRDIGLCIQPTADGNYIIIGRTSENGKYGWLLKINPDGDTIWTRVYQEIWSTWITPASDGGYIISGEVHGDPAILKADSVGGELWTRSYDICVDLGYANYVEQTSDGGFILTGFAGTPIPEDAYIFLVKTDSTGDTIWTKLYYSFWGYGIGRCVKQTNDGGYIVCGHTSGHGGPPPDIRLLKTDSLGDTLWTRSYGDGYKYYQEGESLDITDDGGYIITGYDEESLWLLRTNSSGDTLWTKRYQGKGFGIGQCVLQTEDCGYIITGCTGTSRTEGDAVLLLKTDESGNTIWERTYADQLNDKGNVGYCVQETDDKGYIVVGEVHRRTESGDLYLLKTDSLGLLAVDETVTPPETQPTFEVVTAVGDYVLLSSQSEERSQLGIFDASGRLVDELLLDGPESITWGHGFSPGVYFIRETSGNSITQKVVLVR